MRPPGTGTVAVSVYGSRADVPVMVWTELFGGALEAIDILVYGGTSMRLMIRSCCGVRSWNSSTTTAAK